MRSSRDADRQPRHTASNAVNTTNRIQGPRTTGSPCLSHGSNNQRGPPPSLSRRTILPRVHSSAPVPRHPKNMRNRAAFSLCCCRKMRNSPPRPGPARVWPGQRGTQITPSGDGRHPDVYKTRLTIHPFSRSLPSSPSSHSFPDSNPFHSFGTSSIGVCFRHLFPSPLFSQPEKAQEIEQP